MSEAMRASSCQRPLIRSLFEVFFLVLFCSEAGQFMDHLLTFKPQDIPLGSNNVDPGWEIRFPGIARAKQRVTPVLARGDIRPIKPITRDLQRILRSTFVWSSLQLHVGRVAPIHDWVERQCCLDSPLQAGQLARAQGKVRACAEPSHDHPGFIYG